MRYKVPQNIDMQDRILGPLTMVQFIYAVVGGGLCYMIYMSIPQPFSIVLIFPIAIFTICMVFVKINERPFLDFLLSFIQFMSTPKQRVWHHENISDIKIVTYQAQKVTGPTIQSKTYTQQDIAEIAKKVDKT